MTSNDLVILGTIINATSNLLDNGAELETVEIHTEKVDGIAKIEVRYIVSYDTASAAAAAENLNS